VPHASPVAKEVVVDTPKEDLVRCRFPEDEPLVPEEFDVCHVPIQPDIMVRADANPRLRRVLESLSDFGPDLSKLRVVNRPKERALEVTVGNSAWRQPVETHLREVCQGL